MVGIAIAVFFLGKALDTSSGHFSLLILLASLVYLLLGGWLAWFFVLLVLWYWYWCWRSGCPGVMPSDYGCSA
ncbi:MAG: hypothetical protein ACPG5T_00955 [Endozoicomonas sp.]